MYAQSHSVCDGEVVGETAKASPIEHTIVAAGYSYDTQHSRIPALGLRIAPGKTALFLLVVLHHFTANCE